MNELHAMREHEHPLVRKIAGNCVEHDGCWVWTKALWSKGYGCLWVEEIRAARRAHRVMYDLLVGPVPDGVPLDHLCDNPPCCNPGHLKPATHRENILRGTSPSAVNARKTNCHAGHPLSGENLYTDTDGGRHCRTCRNESKGARRARAKERT